MDFGFPEITGADMNMKGKEDWLYRDLPNMSEENFNKFIELVGNENLQFLTFAKRQWPDGTETMRGQLLISPQGMENVRNYNAPLHQ